MMKFELNMMIGMEVFAALAELSPNNDSTKVRNEMPLLTDQQCHH